MTVYVLQLYGYPIGAYLTKDLAFKAADVHEEVHFKDKNDGTTRNYGVHSLEVNAEPKSV